MYSLHDCYQDIMAKRRDDFTYDNHHFNVVVEPTVITVVHGGATPDRTGGKKIMAFSMRKNVTCMLDLQGMAASLLYRKKDLWFDRHGELCSREEFSPVVTKSQQEEDDLERLMDSVMDISTDDRDVNIQDFI